MEIKYTSDGKKVRVVGQLNSEEKIVQEIFCDDSGAEIPSGENFIVKSLHDKSVKSWKQRDIEKMEALYNEKKDSLYKERQKLERQIKQTRSVIQASMQMEKYIEINELEKLDLFLAGAVTHFVEFGYGIRITKFSDANCDYNRGNMKLLSLYGRSNGNLEWRLSHYSDGSGGSVKVYPCASYDEALEKAQDFINETIAGKGEITDSIKRCAEEHDLKIPQKILNKYKKKKIESAKREIKSLSNRIKGYEKKIEKIKSDSN